MRASRGENHRAKTQWGSQWGFYRDSPTGSGGDRKKTWGEEVGMERAGRVRE